MVVFMVPPQKWVKLGVVLVRVMVRSDTIQITPELLGLIAGIDEFKGAWRALSALAPDRLSALRRAATIESIGSSTRIEGSKLSEREVERLLSNLEIKSFARRNEQEVAGYAEPIDPVFSSWQDIPFTENHLKQLHQILLRYSEKDTWHRGNYKTSSSCIAKIIRSAKRRGIWPLNMAGISRSRSNARSTHKKMPSVGRLGASFGL